MHGAWFSLEVNCNVSIVVRVHQDKRFTLAHWSRLLLDRFDATCQLEPKTHQRILDVPSLLTSGLYNG